MAVDLFHHYNNLSHCIINSFWSAEIKMENYKIKTRFVSTEGPKAQAKKIDMTILTCENVNISCFS